MAKGTEDKKSQPDSKSKNNKGTKSKVWKYYGAIKRSSARRSAESITWTGNPQIYAMDQAGNNKRPVHMAGTYNTSAAYHTSPDERTDDGLGTTLAIAGILSSVGIITVNVPDVSTWDEVSLVVPKCADGYGLGKYKIMLFNTHLYFSINETKSDPIGITSDYIRTVTGRVWAKYIPNPQNKGEEDADYDAGEDAIANMPSDNTIVFADNAYSIYSFIIDQFARHTDPYEWSPNPRSILYSFASSSPDDGALMMLPFYSHPSHSKDTAAAFPGGSALSQMVNWPHVIDYVPSEASLNTGIHGWLDTLSWSYMMSPPPNTMGGKFAPEPLYLYWQPFERVDADDVPYNKETFSLITTGDPRSPWGGGFFAAEPGEEDVGGAASFEGSAFERIRDHVLSVQGTPNELKYDHCFAYEVPYSTDREQAEQVNHPHAMYVDVEASYNYYLPGYEELIKNESISESILPSLLISAAEELSPLRFGAYVGGQLEPLEDFKKRRIDSYHEFVTLNENIEDVFIDTFRKWDVAGFTAHGTPKLAYDYINTSLEEDRGNYFEKWVKVFTDFASDSTPLEVFAEFKKDVYELEKKWKNQMIFVGTDSEGTSPTVPGKYFIHDFESRKFMFPMQVTIKIGTQSEKYPDAHKLLTLLHKHGVVYSLLKTIKEKVSGNESERVMRFWDDRRTEDSNASLFDLYNTEKYQEAFKWGDPDVFPEGGPEKFSLRFYGRPDIPGSLNEIGATYLPSTWVAAFDNGADIYSYYTETAGDFYPPILASFNTDSLPRVMYIPQYWQWANFKDELNDLVKEKTRTYQEIVEGKLACTEILFWRVEKIEIKTNVYGEPVANTIQNFFITDPFELNEFRLVDTQVKYGKFYTYKVYAWKAVFGTEYTYLPLNVHVADQMVKQIEEIVPPHDIPPPDELGGGRQRGQEKGSPGEAPMVKKAWDFDISLITPGNPDVTDGIPDWQLLLNVASWPSIKIIECPWFTSSPVVILDKPPLPPRVKFIQYQAIDNTYLIYLKSAVGQTKRFFDLILPEDYEIGLKMITNQKALEVAGLQEESELLIFESDDPASSFEIFVIGPDPMTDVTVPPESYFDFSKGERIIIPLDYAASATYRPAIKPNKIYYYTCRSTDIHGNMSFPSPIYKVQLTNDGGAVYLTTEVYEFPKPKKIMKKTMRKYLNITPAMHQSTMQYFEERALRTWIHKEPSFGEIDDTLFNNGKKYKIRLTSKNSGRKIDINVGFKATRKTTQFDTKYVDKSDVSYSQGYLAPPPDEGMPSSFVKHKVVTKEKTLVEQIAEGVGKGKYK